MPSLSRVPVRRPAPKLPTGLASRGERRASVAQPALSAAAYGDARSRGHALAAISVVPPPVGGALEHDSVPAPDGIGPTTGVDFARIHGDDSRTARSVGSSAPIQCMRGTLFERRLKDGPPAARQLVSAIRDDKTGLEMNKGGLLDAFNTMVQGVREQADPAQTPEETASRASVGQFTGKFGSFETGAASLIDLLFQSNNFVTGLRKRFFPPPNADQPSTAERRALENHVLASGEQASRDIVNAAASFHPAAGEALGSILPGVSFATVAARGKDTTQKVLASVHLKQISQSRKRFTSQHGADEVRDFKRERKRIKNAIRSGEMSPIAGFAELADRRRQLGAEARSNLLLREFRKEARKAVRNQAIDTGLLAAGAGAAPATAGISGAAGATAAAGRQTLSLRNKVTKQIELLTDWTGSGGGKVENRLRAFGTSLKTTKARAKRKLVRNALRLADEQAVKAERIDLPLNRRDALANQAAAEIVDGTPTGRAIAEAARLAGASGKILRSGDEQAIESVLRNGLLSSKSRGVLEQGLGAARAVKDFRGGTKRLRRLILNRPMP